MANRSDNRILLEKYLQDPTKKLLWSDKNGGVKRYEFQTLVHDFPDEVRVSTAFFYDDGKIVRLTRSTGRYQKFLCVGGPLDASKVTEEDGKDYVLFNRSNSRGKKDQGVPSAVLIHRKLLVS